MTFDFIASTGRTATTYVASVLNTVDGVMACHEGQNGSDKSDVVLPLINLENAQCYAKPEMAHTVVDEKRGPDLIRKVLQDRKRARLIDVAYYNPTISLALLAKHPSARMIGIVRNCDAFVRSATTTTGEDPLPVGWADPEKPLTDREKFIAMGRIRPDRKSPIKPLWKDWGGIERNIWLWHETNILLAQAQRTCPDRVTICRFETLQENPVEFWRCIGHALGLEIAPPQRNEPHERAINKKPAGYQVNSIDKWSVQQKSMLHIAQEDIENRINYDC